MPYQRQDSLERIRQDGGFDVVVVGGGINGIGVFRELALQGLRVLLVERNDFCSGCSAAPSRMIHGGLRYLENGEFNLVWESLRERDALLANAPHMVRPLPTTIPITSLFSGMMNGAVGFFGLSGRPASRGAVPIKIGLLLYDWITRHRRLLPRHKVRGARETLRLWPGLSPKLRFSATYHDAWISHPERLGVELLLDTQRLAPASIAVNYAELRPDGGGYVMADGPTGSALPVSTRAIVNATGAWLDESLGLIAGDDGIREPFVSGTKGSHLILDHPQLHAALDGQMIFFEHADGRVCIVFPYLGKVLAGSTDIRVERASRVRCEPDERAYILEALGQVFPDISVAEAHIVFSYSGIRPLPRSDHEFTGRISRGHFVHRVDGPVPQFCMVGGKWTTFRAFGEQAADAVLAELGRTRVTSTLGLAIGGGAGFPTQARALELALAQRHGIGPERAAHLADVYGTRAADVLAFCLGRDDDTPLRGSCQVTGAEIAFLARHEYVHSLGDVLLRRTPISIRGDVSTGIVERVAAILAAELGWDGELTRREIDRFVADLADYHGVSPDMLARRDLEGNQPCA
jgi:glycerol-3-phosphate dehydrogenase